MPISRTTFENAARDLGHSRGQAKKIAARIMARPDLDFITEQLTQRGWLPHHDPTADEALWRVMHAALAGNVLETAS